MGIVRAFFDIDMRLGQTGLGQTMIAAGVKPTAIKSGDFVMFMNKKKTMVKVLWDHVYMLQIRKTEGKISIEDLYRIPDQFKKWGIAGPVEKKILYHLGKPVQMLKEAV